MPSYERKYFAHYPPDYQRVTEGYHQTVNCRVLTGYPNWGLVIYRGAYGDDALWAKCIALLKDSAARWLDWAKQQDVLGPDLLWTIVEDRPTLEGATKAAVRARFRDWAAARSVERDGPGADGPWVKKMIPRFRYCIYIDQTCLDTISAKWDPRLKHWDVEGQFVVINATNGWGPHGFGPDDYYEGIPQLEEQGAPSKAPTDQPEDENEYEDSDYEESVYDPIEGDTSFDVGWAYKDLAFSVRHYEALHKGGGQMDWEVWRFFWERKRPDAATGSSTFSGVPLAALDLSQKE